MDYRHFVGLDIIPYVNATDPTGLKFEDRRRPPNSTKEEKYNSLKKIIRGHRKFDIIIKKNLSFLFFLPVPQKNACQSD